MKYGIEAMGGYNFLVALPNGSPVTITGTVNKLSNNMYNMSIFENDLNNINMNDSSTTFKVSIYVIDDINASSYKSESYLHVNGIRDLSGEM